MWTRNAKGGENPRPPYCKIRKDDIQAYHGYQSFKPGEVTPDVAHAIGVQLANELWGVDFPVIVIPPPSKRHRIRMNRLFRERVGGAFLPFPEVDNLCERALSKLRVKLKINEFFDRRKEQKRAR